MPLKRNLLTAALLICFAGLLAQDESHHEDREMVGSEHGIHNDHHHQIQFVLAHTHISRGLNTEGKRTWLALASWGLNYNYHFNQKWTLGLHTDFILEQFEVESGEVVLERSRPLALAGMAGYKFWGPMTALVGGGVELAEEENFSFLRLGLEPSWPFAKGKWEFSILGVYEIKLEAYNSWFAGFGISRLF
jgi:opacity protein-like surface antigen